MCDFSESPDKKSEAASATPTCRRSKPLLTPACNTPGWGYPEQGHLRQAPGKGSSLWAVFLSHRKQWRLCGKSTRILAVVCLLPWSYPVVFYGIPPQNALPGCGETDWRLPLFWCSCCCFSVEWVSLNKLPVLWFHCWVEGVVVTLFWLWMMFFSVMGSSVLGLPAFVSLAFGAFTLAVGGQTQH